ncbi:MAG: carbohydrate ABC transporter permease [Clostridia bacterium]|nr:carbohydrate ABC transporter permease [Clostridia bacterium]
MKKQKLLNQAIFNLLFIFVCMLVIIPFVLVVSASLSSEKDIVEYGYQIIPKNLDLSAYRYIFKNPKSIINAYKITFLFSVIYTFLSTLLMSMLAHMLSKRNLKGKSFFAFYIYFTMLFSGGLVPTYILNTQMLHLDDTIWIYIVPSLITPWYVFLLRTFFQGIPYEINEAAVVDGANEYTIFLKIVLPLSKPALATVALFMFLGKWNDWYTSMLYINDESLISLQYLLQRIMQNIKLIQEASYDTSMLAETTEIPSETVRMAMAIVVAGPALVVFPFFQKYFVKGLTVGSVKG